MVSTKVDLQQRMTNALPGDTVIVVNGTYNFGQINFSNTNGTNTSNWIVLKAETVSGVTFTGNTYLQFSGKRIHVTGFRFATGNAGNNDVVQFRSTSTNLAFFCRLSNITIDRYNSDSTGSVAGTLPDIDNKWVSIYGTNNRVDHCTFIQKNNAGATITVWYDNTNYPQPSTSTYHVIDSNYFNGRGYLGDNGGETIRVGTSTTSRTDGFNTIAYNLFENCRQTEPEIISNKSDFNSYYANTFKNCNGGLTLRHGRYCKVFSNFFIVDDATITRAYGIRVIDKGHVIVNNYFEGLNGNRNSLTSARCPIILYNGLSSTNDTVNASKASGYFPADSTIVAFNSIINCSGGAGIVVGYTDGGDNTFQPKGVVVANNLVKLMSGQAAYIDAVNTELTYTAEGNIVNAPNGIGLVNAGGFTSINFTVAARQNYLFLPPSIVQDAAINSNTYQAYIQGRDVFGKTRNTVFDVGAMELNTVTNSLLYNVLDSTMVGVKNAVQLLSNDVLLFTGELAQHSFVDLSWTVTNPNIFSSFLVEQSIDGIHFTTITSVIASVHQSYSVQVKALSTNAYFRLKLLYANGRLSYTNIIKIVSAHSSLYTIYPNPAHSFFYIKGIDSNGKKLHVRIIDMYGEVVLQKIIHSLTQSIPVNTLKGGSYVVQIIDDQYQNVFSQLLKIHSKK